MKVVRRVAIVLVAVVLALCLLQFLLIHGDAVVLLEVSVIVVEEESGQPLPDAFVATLFWRGSLENEEWYRWTRDQLRKGGMEEQRFDDPLPAATTDEGGCAVVRSGAPVTIRMFGPISWRGDRCLPEVLVVDHPKTGRHVFPIDPDAPVQDRDQGRGWKLDLGTIRVPSRPAGNAAGK